MFRSRAPSTSEPRLITRGEHWSAQTRDTQVYLLKTARGAQLHGWTNRTPATHEDLRRALQLAQWSANELQVPLLPPTAVLFGPLQSPAHIPAPWTDHLPNPGYWWNPLLSAELNAPELNHDRDTCFHSGAWTVYVSPGHTSQIHLQHSSGAALLATGPQDSLNLTLTWLCGPPGTLRSALRALPGRELIVSASWSQHPAADELIPPTPSWQRITSPPRPSL